MEKKVVETEKTSKPIGPFSKAIKITNPRTLIFSSGHTGRTREGVIVKGDIKAQAKQTFENIKSVLEAGGATLKDVIKITTFLTDRRDYAAYNEVRRQYFTDTLPASSTVIVKELVAEELLVEVEVVVAM